jgi:hypothetical protein
MHKRLIATALAAALAATTGAAFAANQTPVAPREQWMSVEQVTDLFSKQGYDVRQVKVEDKGYEVYALDKDGKRFEADIDPVTGAVIKSEASD